MGKKGKRGEGQLETQNIISRTTRNFLTIYLRWRLTYVLDVRNLLSKRWSARHTSLQQTNYHTSLGLIEESSIYPKHWEYRNGVCSLFIRKENVLEGGARCPAKRKMDIDYWEILWFVGVTVAINCLVFVVCGVLELVDRYGLFQDAKIQKKVPRLPAS